jgi:DNA-binding NarL/FixJ family response regulator
MPDTFDIAVVDDQTMIRKGLCALINDLRGCRVVLDAADGLDLEQGLKDSHPPHIVLLDIEMPRRDGYATAAWLTAHHPSVRIIALSVLATEIAIIRMIRSGARGYLLKEAEPAELLRAFKEVMTQGFYYNDQVSRKILGAATSLVHEKRDWMPGAGLTPRELEFLRLACSEKTYRHIAADMFVSERTIDGYREALFQKLGVTSRVGLVLYALRHKLVNLDEPIR